MKEDSDDDAWEYTVLKRFKRGKLRKGESKGVETLSTSTEPEAEGRRGTIKLRVGSRKKQARENTPEISLRNIPPSQPTHLSSGKTEGFSRNITLSDTLSVVSNSQSQSSSSNSSPKSPPLSQLQARTPCQSQKRKKKKFTPVKHRKVHEGFCPSCQMPLSLLLIQSPNWHVTECINIMSAPGEKTECESGGTCDATIPSHYHKFRHTALALARDCGEVDSLSMEDQSSFQTLKEPSLVRMLPFQASSEERASLSQCNKKEMGISSNKRQLCQIATQQDVKMAFKIEPDDQQEDGVDSISDEDIFGEREDFFSEADGAHNKDNEKGMSISSCDGQLFQIATQQGVEMTFEIEPDDQQEDEVDIASDEDIFDENEDHCSEANDVVEEVADVPLNHVSQGNSDEKSNLSVHFDDDVEELLTDKHWCDKVTEKRNTHEVLVISDTESVNMRTCRQDKVKQKTFTSSEENVNVECKKQTSSQEVIGTKQTSIFSFFKSSHSTADHKPNAVADHKPNAVPAVIQTKVLRNPISKLQGPKMYEKNIPGVKNLVTDKQNARKNYSAEAKPRGGWKKSCPFYKKIPGTPFTVDAFCYGVVPGCSAYFLSHFHYDHYRGLSKHFKQPIYCSQVTLNLVKKQIRVEEKYLMPLPLNTPCTVHGVQVTLIEANHCPGAVLFFFQLQNGRNILHTGDFRADSAMVEHPALKGKKIHQLYLDTTYCDPSYAFPPQQDVIDIAVSLAKKHVSEHPNTLIVCGTYTIGKERIFIAIAEGINSKVCVTKEKKRILDCLGDNKLNQMITTSWPDARVHVLPMAKLRKDILQAHLRGFKGQFDNILAFEPTGWTHSGKTPSLKHLKPKVDKEGIVIYGVPYSEHSSYTEMRNFVEALQPEDILPTVNNGNPASRKKMESLFKLWLNDKKHAQQESPLKLWLKDKKHT